MILIPRKQRRVRGRVRGREGCYSDRVVMVGISGEVTLEVRSAYEEEVCHVAMEGNTL